MWIEKPGNPCILIPTYNWSQACIDKREPIKLTNASVNDCKLSEPSSENGYREYDDVAGPQEKLCWRMRKCANSCTELSGAIGTIDNRVAPGCDASTINPRTTNLFEARCNPGTTDGNDSSDIDGPMSEDWWNCKGMLSPCVEN